MTKCIHCGFTIHQRGTQWIHTATMKHMCPPLTHATPPPPDNRSNLQKATDQGPAPLLHGPNIIMTPSQKREYGEMITYDLDTPHLKNGDTLHIKHNIHYHDP